MQHVKRKAVYFPTQQSKIGKKHGTEITLNLSSNGVGESNDKTNLPHKLI